LVLVLFPTVTLIRQSQQIDPSKIKIYAACVSLQKRLLLNISNGLLVWYGYLHYLSSGKGVVYSHPSTIKELKCSTQPCLVQAARNSFVAHTQLLCSDGLWWCSMTGKKLRISVKSSWSHCDNKLPSLKPAS